MKNVLLFVSCLVFGLSFSQNDEAFVDAQVAQKLAELEMQQNPEYFVRKGFCDGNVQLFIMPDGSKCASASTYFEAYVFWKEGADILKLQKFDNCGSFLPFQIVVEKPVRKLLEDKNGLQTEAASSSTEKTSGSNPYANMAVSSCHSNYTFVFEGKSFTRKITELKGKEATKNKASALNRLDAELSEMIKNLEQSGKFFREK